MSARGWMGGLLVLLCAVAAGFAWNRLEGNAPTLETPDRIVVAAGGASVELILADEGAGLRSLHALWVHARGEAVLADIQFPGGRLAGGDLTAQPKTIALRFDPGQHRVPEGDGFLRVVVRDWSWSSRLAGNETRREIPVHVDVHPPRVSVSSGLTYVRRGGAGAVVYDLDEDAARDGVRVGDVVFRGFPAPGAGPGSHRRIALFAVPTDAPRDPAIRVFAEDAAGNRAEASWPVVVKERELPAASVRLPKSFLENTVRRLAREAGIPTDDLPSAFQRINEDLRSANEARIREAVADSSQTKLWSGAFAQLRNSKVTSRFAEHRQYFVDGVVLSEATHFGFDLAATRAGPITASNAGRIVYADSLGIYGNCVVMDHGQGLSSLYGHLSRLDVSVGDAVVRGQQLGLSGATGLAGGDHLHFAILVGETYVDPIEWWDPNWVQTHIEIDAAP